MKKLNKNQLDKTPKYTVKEVSQIMKISTHTIRYYDNEGLIPFVSRTQSNIRKFSDHSLSWLKTIHHLRSTNLSINDIKKYIDLSLKGKRTIKQRAEIIFALCGIVLLPFKHKSIYFFISFIDKFVVLKQ